MKPKNLKFPHTWDERRPVLHEGVLIVPQHFDRHTERDFSELFPIERSISIEYCSGNGDWIIEKAQKNPDRLWVAVEKRFDRVRKIWSKMHNNNIKNLLIVAGEALTFTRDYLKEGIIEEIYVNFPDPWPKERHAKHRLIQEPFVDEIARIVKPGGRAVYVTDDGPYSAQMIDQMQTSGKWQNAFPSPCFKRGWDDDYGRSWFQQCWQGKGHDFYFIEYRRI